MKNHRNLVSAIALFALLGFSGNTFAQEAPQPSKKIAAPPGEVIVFEREVAVPGQEGRIRVPAPPGHPIGDETIHFVSSEMSLDGKVVKGAPYSAEAITESTRTLGDGNRIKHKNSATVYRDSEGRTRRDQQLGSVGPWATTGDPLQTIFINDPVAKVNYVLDPRTRVARKMAPLRIALAPGVAPVTAPGRELKADREVKVRVNQQEVFMAPAPAPHPHAGGLPMHEFHVRANPQKGTTESLGKQTIEGVLADGTRTTVTIPAGEVGNEQPIQITWEKWYSPELQTVVMSKHNDPLVGENVYRLTNIVRGEPSRTLFEVPADYVVKEAPLRRRVQMKAPMEEK